MSRISIICIALMVLGCIPVSAQTIADRLASRENVKISQPAALNARLAKNLSTVTTGAESEGSTIEDVTSASTTAGGYRVQVFSDNNPRTAKREAQSKADAIAGAFPEWGTYITFDSPYWRLRVGDFRTYEDATHAVVELKNAFPAWRRELRVVRDRIRVNE